MTDESTRSEDEQVLAALVEAGHDLTQPMLIEFELLVDSESAAESLANAAEAAEFTPHIYAATPDDEQTDVWVCVCGRTMMADISALQAARQQLQKLAEPHNGQLESWGTFGNADANRG